MLTLDDNSIVTATMREAENANLINSQGVFDTLVLRLPGSDAAADSGGWKAPALPVPLAFISQFDNLYDINRGGIENAMCAGLESAATLLSKKP